MCPLDTKDQNVAGFHPSEPSPGHRHELIAKLTAPRGPQVHFRTFENLILFQKRTLVKLLR